MYRVCSPEFRKVVVAASKHIPINELAKDFGISRGTIWRWRQRAAYSNTKEFLRQDRKIDIEKLKEFTRTWHFTRMSYRLMAVHFKVSVSSIHKRIQNLRKSGYITSVRSRDTFPIVKRRIKKY
ncbi:transposase [Elusimicrobium simillimum]|uniref:IS630 transposase-related protein n=1 Tax=Elusimicrobium simillimum TaxID=3143438 RepID=UPI003C6FA2F2